MHSLLRPLPSEVLLLLLSEVDKEEEETVVVVAGRGAPLRWCGDV